MEIQDMADNGTEKIIYMIIIYSISRQSKSKSKNVAK